MTLERIDELSPRAAYAAYAAFMAVWVVAFARTERPLPSLLVGVLLLLPAVVHFGVGYAVGEWSALYAVAVPIVVAAAAGGLPSALWLAIVLLTAFPGAPLVAAGVWVREWRERRDPGSMDPWLT